MQRYDNTAHVFCLGNMDRKWCFLKARGSSGCFSVQLHSPKISHTVNVWNTINCVLSNLNIIYVNSLN